MLLYFILYFIYVGPNLIKIPYFTVFLYIIALTPISYAGNMVSRSDKALTPTNTRPSSPE